MQGLCRQIGIEVNPGTPSAVASSTFFKQCAGAARCNGRRQRRRRSRTVRLRRPSTRSFRLLTAPRDRSMRSNQRSGTADAIQVRTFRAHRPRLRYHQTGTSFGLCTGRPRGRVGLPRPLPEHTRSDLRTSGGAVLPSEASHQTPRLQGCRVRDNEVLHSRPMLLVSAS